MINKIKSLLKAGKSDAEIKKILSEEAELTNEDLDLDIEGGELELTENHKHWLESALNNTQYSIQELKKGQQASTNQVITNLKDVERNIKMVIDNKQTIDSKIKADSDIETMYFIDDTEKLKKSNEDFPEIPMENADKIFSNDVMDCLFLIKGKNGMLVDGGAGFYEEDVKNFLTASIKADISSIAIQHELERIIEMGNVNEENNPLKSLQQILPALKKLNSEIKKNDKSEF